MGAAVGDLRFAPLTHHAVARTAISLSKSPPKRGCRKFFNATIYVGPMHSREAAAQMPNAPQKPRGSGYRNLVVVVVLVIATWAVFTAGVLLLLGLSLP